MFKKITLFAVLCIAGLSSQSYANHKKWHLNNKSSQAIYAEVRDGSGAKSGFQKIGSRGYSVLATDSPWNHGACSPHFIIVDAAAYEAAKAKTPFVLPAPLHETTAAGCENAQQWFFAYKCDNGVVGSAFIGAGGGPGYPDPSCGR